MTKTKDTQRNGTCIPNQWYWMLILSYVGWCFDFNRVNKTKHGLAMYITTYFECCVCTEMDRVVVWCSSVFILIRQRCSFLGHLWEGYIKIVSSDCVFFLIRLRFFFKTYLHIELQLHTSSENEAAVVKYTQNGHWLLVDCRSLSPSHQHRENQGIAHNAQNLGGLVRQRWRGNWYCLQ